MTDAEYSRKIWAAVLEEFLGWTPTETVAWAQANGYLERLRDPNDLIYHETPQYWVVPEIVSHLAPEIPPGREREEAWRDVLRIIETGEPRNGGLLPEDTDWQPYREDVERLLAHYKRPTIQTRVQLGDFPQISAGTTAVRKKIRSPLLDPSATVRQYRTGKSEYAHLAI